MPINSGGASSAHLLRDQRAPIAALRHVARVAEALHQHGPGAGDAGGVPAGRGRLAGKAVAGHRRDHQMERIRCARAMRRGIGQRIDDLQLLDDRAGPPVRDDERQRIFVFRADVDEMNVQPVDFGHEIRQGVQLRLDLAPVVVVRPIARELLNRRELHALRFIRDRLPLGPHRRVDAPAQVGKFLFRSAEGERADRGALVGVVRRGGRRADSKPAAPAAEAARTWRRVGVDEVSDMITLPDVNESGVGAVSVLEDDRCSGLRPIGPLRLATTDLGMVGPRCSRKKRRRHGLLRAVSAESGSI